MAEHRKKKWSELSPAGKFGVVGALAAHVVLVGLAHRDLSHRPADEIRGPKWVWRMATAANSTMVGAYFLFARRSATHR
ncbi:MAG: hypothetical protein JST73_05395 [Actinobacteria bacterium]|nr:hypothetical protein [Actinomycetota bacterium]